jgi:hypothetical protein
VCRNLPGNLKSVGTVLPFRLDDWYFPIYV